MKKLILLFFSFVCISVHAQHWDWARKADATTSNESVEITRTDGFGNLYLYGSGNGGSQYGTTTLVPGKFIVKFDSLGVVIWAQNVNIIGDGYTHSFNVDSDGNIYLLGHFTFIINILSFNFVSNGEEDIFIIKLDPSGNPIWGRHFGGAGGDMPGSVAIDDDLNVYFDGDFRDSVYFDVYPLYDSIAHFFLTKLDSSGNALWVTKGDASFFVGGLIKLDIYSNVYVVGLTNYGYGYFISKFDPAGNLLWHQQKWGMYDYVPTLVVSDSGNIYLLHNGIGHYGFLPILVKYDSLMNEQWSQGIGTYYGCYQFGTDIFIDKSENIYVGGGIGGYYCHEDSVYFLSQLAYIGLAAIPAIAKINTNGNLMWIKEGLSADYDGIGTICQTKSGNFYAAGTFNNTTTGDGDTLTFDAQTLINDGNWHQIFITKLNLSDVSTPVDQLATVNSIEIFPNPTSGIFTVQLNSPQEEATVSVCDILGNCVLKKECRNKTSQEIDLSLQPQGIYFVEFIAGETRIVRKMIVQ